VLVVTYNVTALSERELANVRARLSDRENIDPISDAPTMMLRTIRYEHDPKVSAYPMGTSIREKEL
jgi:hypothetical protein